MRNCRTLLICNHSDPAGRYAYNQQPQIGLWNLACLAQALTPIISTEDAEAALQSYRSTYAERYTALMGQKLGLTHASKDDASLVNTLLDMMHTSHADYTNLFRSLSHFKSAPGEKNAALRDQFIDRTAFDTWSASYRDRLQREQGSDAERKTRMNKVNPKYILRNHLAQTAINKAEQGRDFSEVDRLLRLLQHPFNEQPEMEDYAATPPEWARHITVNCSS
ncbi:MAG: protein adenylyltransferase SelO family protein [Gammaproteobacteria bacterium]